MGKDARARVLADHQAKAIGRNMRISPRKLNLVAQSIRGKRAEAALNELTFSPKRVAKAVKKVLQSAIANAENNHDLDVDDLVVSEASVGKNMVMKRFHARARGRGAAIEKPFARSRSSSRKSARRRRPSPKTPHRRPRRRAKKAPAKKKAAAKKSASKGAKKSAPKKSAKEKA